MQLPERRRDGFEDYLTQGEEGRCLMLSEMAGRKMAGTAGTRGRRMADTPGTRGRKMADTPGTRGRTCTETPETRGRKETYADRHQCKKHARGQIRKASCSRRQKCCFFNQKEHVQATRMYQHLHIQFSRMSSISFCERVRI